MNDYIWDSMKPTIEGIFDKIQYCLEQLSDDFDDPKKYVVEGYAKLLQEMLNYAQT